VKQQVFTVMLFVMVVSCAYPLRAGDDWSLTKLNPFKKKSSEPQRAQASLSDEDSRDAGFPDLFSQAAGQRDRTAPPADDPSAWDRMSEGTKAFWGKTKNVLMPWNKKSKASRTRSAKKPSIFTSWLLPKKQPQRPQTVKDFLGQPRPGF